MANRIIVIKCCEECHHFRDGGCFKLGKELGKRIQSDKGFYYEIPDECPLMLENSKSESSSSGFTTYDSRGGHCPLCGSLFCHGNCFK